MRGRCGCGPPHLFDALIVGTVFVGPGVAAQTQNTRGYCRGTWSKQTRVTPWNAPRILVTVCLSVPLQVLDPLAHDLLHGSLQVCSLLRAKQHCSEGQQAKAHLEGHCVLVHFTLRHVVLLGVRNHATDVFLHVSERIPERPVDGHVYVRERDGPCDDLVVRGV
jgi:hypothetical protein